MDNGKQTKKRFHKHKRKIRYRHLKPTTLGRFELQMFLLREKTIFFCFFLIKRYLIESTLQNGKKFVHEIMDCITVCKGD